MSKAKSTVAPKPTIGIKKNLAFTSTWSKVHSLYVSKNQGVYEYAREQNERENLCYHYIYYHRQKRCLYANILVDVACRKGRDTDHKSIVFEDIHFAHWTSAMF